jgi:predicted dehydrogenase
MQLGIHALDLVHFMAGRIEEVHAFAQSVTTQPDVIDSVTATFRLRSGRLGTMVSNYCTPVRFEYRVSGTEGVLQCTPHHLWYRSAADSDRAGDGPAETQDFMAFGMESYVLQMQAFGEAVQQRTPPPIDGQAGLQALAVVEAMQKSAESGAPQPIPSFIEQPSAA